MKNPSVFPSVFGRLFRSGGSSPGAAALSMKAYRGQVMRDLRWLLNSRCHPASSAVHRYPLAAASVINFGMRDMSGALDSQVEVEDVIQAVKSAIARFEPRIVPGSVSVTVVGTPGTFDIDAFALEIHGDLWARPVNEPLTLRSEWNAVSGRWSLV